MVRTPTELLALLLTDICPETAAIIGATACARACGNQIGLLQRGTERRTIGALHDGHPAQHAHEHEEPRCQK